MIKVLVEKSKDGTYWGTTQNIPGVVSGDGATFEQMKKALYDGMEMYLEDIEEQDKKVFNKLKSGYEFEYKMSLEDFFNKFPEIKISNLANRMNISPSLMRQYSSGNTYISESRIRQIENTIHQLGNELQSVYF